MQKFSRVFAITATTALAAAAFAQPAATDLGALSQGETRRNGVAVNGASIVWFQFDLPAVTDANDFYLDIFTQADAGDSEIGLYDSAGNLIASDDDDGASVRSALSFGSTFPYRPLEDGEPHDGRDGDLTPGTYYLAVGNYNTTFLPAAFGVTSVSTANNTFDLVLTLGQQPAPPADRWSEQNTGDAGELPGTAQSPQGSGTLGSIRGLIDGIEDVDMFEIAICDVTNFSATTSGTAEFDTQLWLFDSSGNGVAFNDDTPPGGEGVESTLSNQFVSGNGTYYIAVSAWDRDALDAGGIEIWADTPFAAERAPDGLGSGPVASWGGIATSSGQYIITLSGACFPGGSPNCAPCAADYDQSGGVDGDDIGAFFDDWRQGAQCADVDSSGGVDGDDIGFFFDRWTAGGCN